MRGNSAHIFIHIYIYVSIKRVPIISVNSHMVNYCFVYVTFNKGRNRKNI